MRPTGQPQRRVAVGVVVVVAELEVLHPQLPRPAVRHKPPQQPRMPMQDSVVVVAAVEEDEAAQHQSPGYRSFPGRQPSITITPRTSPNTTRKDTACLLAVPGCMRPHTRW